MNPTIFKISTHVLDTNKGRPVPNLPIKLYRLKSECEWALLSEGKTNTNGRLDNCITSTNEFEAGIYKLSFETKTYYDAANEKTLYPFIELTFSVEKSEHYHIPLLLNSFGFTTYRGS